MCTFSAKRGLDFRIKRHFIHKLCLKVFQAALYPQNVFQIVSICIDVKGNFASSLTLPRDVKDIPASRRFIRENRLNVCLEFEKKSCLILKKKFLEKVFHVVDLKRFLECL